MVQTRFAVWILVISLFLNVLFAHSSQNVWATPRISPKQVFVPPTLHSKDYNLREFETFSLLITNPQLELVSIFGFKKICSVNSNVEPFLIRLSKDTQPEQVRSLQEVSKIVFRSNNYLVLLVEDLIVLEAFPFIHDREHLRFLPKYDAPLNVTKFIPSASSTKSEVVKGVDGSAVNEIIKKLSGASPVVINGKQSTINTRYTYGNDIKIAADYVDAYFKSYGLETIRQTFTVRSTQTQNVIGVKKGKTKPNEIVVVGAHYDSISEKSDTLAPGAIDDGSGSASVLHLVNVTSGITFDRTVHFVVFSGEEQGIYGSAYYVDQALKDKNNKITNALLMDMISYSSRYFGVTVEGTKDYEELLAAVSYNMESLKTRSDFTVSISRNSFGSDHVSFQKAGIPAILAIEKDDTDYPCYHRTCDTEKYVNVPQTTQIVRGIAGSLCDLAGVPL